MQSLELEIRNPSGLHARPAATLVRAAALTRSRVRLENLDRAGTAVDAKSILGVLSLGASKGAHVRLSVDGEDEVTAFADLSALIAGGLGEQLDP